MTLEKIILDCQNNEPFAQEQLYILFSKKMFGICLKYSANYADAQDNLQDGFLQIFRTIQQYKNQGSFEGWAKRVMINNTLQQFRKIKHLQIVIDTVQIEEDFEIETENLTEVVLLKMIQDLPERYRLVFNLFAIDNYSHLEISEMLSISVGTSKSNLSRARQILKEKILVAKKQLQSI